MRGVYAGVAPNLWDVIKKLITLSQQNAVYSKAILNCWRAAGGENRGFCDEKIQGFGVKLGNPPIASADYPPPPRIPNFADKDTHRRYSNRQFQAGSRIPLYLPE
jgi:hypothetical protein